MPGELKIVIRTANYDDDSLATDPPRAYSSVSQDGGRTWSLAKEEPHLHNAKSKGFFGRASNGTHIYVYNDGPSQRGTAPGFPHGGRTSLRYKTKLDGYVRQGANDRLLIVNIESAPAIQVLDEILAVPGLDAVLIGPHDLSCNLGIPERYDHPNFLGACETVFLKARAAGVGAGIHFWGSVEQQAHFLKLGANLLIHSGDILLFQKHLAAELKAVKQAAGRVKETRGERAKVKI